MITCAAILTILVVKEEFDPAADARNDNRASESSSAVNSNVFVIPALLSVAMIIMLANMSIEPLINVLVATLGVASESVARASGVVMACSALGSMLTAARLGALADRIGGWNVIIGCLILAALSIIPQAFAKTWWQLAGLRFLMGMALAGLLPSVAKIARQSVEEWRTGRVLGYVQSAQYAGQVLGPILGGQIGVWFGLRAMFFVTSALLFLSGGVACLAHRTQRPAVAGLTRRVCDPVPRGTSTRHCSK
jgi:DHA1 family multidrug resistance protein-like MFS transporter